MKKLIVLVVGFMLFISSVVSVVPFEIKNVEATTEFKLNAAAGNGIVRLWWGEVPGATQGYYLYRGNSSGGQYLMPLTDFGILGNIYFDTNVTDDTNYQTLVTNLNPGVNTFTWNISNGLCYSNNRKCWTNQRGWKSRNRYCLYCHCDAEWCIF